MDAWKQAIQSRRFNDFVERQNRSVHTDQSFKNGMCRFMQKNIK